MSLDPSRRSVLLIGLGALAAGCSSANPSASPRQTSSRRKTASSEPPASHSASPTPTPSASARTHTPTSKPSPRPAALPAVRPWTPGGNEVTPAAKLAAVRRIESDGNTRTSAVQVIDAQYGGILSDSASVLVVTRSWTRRGGDVSAGGHTFDVRLSRSGRRWRVTAINPSRPGSPARHSAAARRVLASDRIDLPPAARLDVESGLVHDSVLTAMLSLARDFRLGVSVVRSGHPIYVFGTNRHSDHPQGRAFDTWQLNGHPVVDARTPKSLITDYMHAAADAGSYNVGGPYLLGAAPQWFSDDTHHDHVHAGFRT